MVDVQKPKSWWWRILEILAAVTTIFAFVVAYAQYQSDSRQRILTATIKSIELASLAPDAPAIQLLFKGRTVSRPVKYIAAISLTGRDPVKKEDFVAPLTLRFGEKVAVLSASVIDVTPKDLVAKASSDEHAVFVTSDLLNPGDVIRVEIFADGPPSAPEFSGRIAGIGTLVLTRESPQAEKRIPIFVLPLPKWMEWTLLGVVAIAVASCWFVTLRHGRKALRPAPKQKSNWTIERLNSSSLMKNASVLVPDERASKLLALLAPGSQFDELWDRDAFLAAARRGYGILGPLPADFEDFAREAFVRMSKTNPMAAKMSLQSESGVLDHPEVSKMLSRSPDQFDGPGGYLLALFNCVGDAAVAAGKIRMKRSEVVGAVIGVLIVGLVLAAPTLLLVHAAFQIART